METPEELLALSRAHFGANVLASATELGIFEALARGPRTVGQVADERSLDAGATRVLLDALVALGVLESTDGWYRPVVGIDAAVAPGCVDSVLPYLRHMARSRAALARLSDVVRAGPGRAVRDLFERDAAAARDFALAMDVLARRLAPEVIGRLALDDRRRLLDVGAGSGAYAAAALARWPHLAATLVDRPEALAVAREKLEAARLDDRAELVAADYLVDPLPAGHDVALLSAVLHQHDDAECAKLLTRVAKALVPGGLVVVRDWVLDDTRTVPAEGAVFSAAILATTGRGRARSEPELRTLLEGAGFEDLHVVHRGAKDSLVTAAKPAAGPASGGD